MIVSDLNPVAGSHALFARTFSARCAAAALALMLGACSCDDSDPWRATYISTAEAATDAGQMAAVEPPACDVGSSDTVETRAKTAGTNVDPNLVEIARLEVERDCYKGAEENLRQRLEGVAEGAVLK